MAPPAKKSPEQKLATYVTRVHKRDLRLAKRAKRMSDARLYEILVNIHVGAVSAPQLPAEILSRWVAPTDRGVDGFVLAACAGGRSRCLLLRAGARA